MTATMKATLFKVFLLVRVFIGVTVFYITNSQLFCSLPFEPSRRGRFCFGHILIHLKLDWILSFCLTVFLDSELLRSPLHSQGKNLFPSQFWLTSSDSVLLLCGEGE